MKSIPPRRLDSDELDVYALAQKAARHAGVDLAEWVQEVVADYAHALGLRSSDMDSQTSLEALKQKLEDLIQSTEVLQVTGSRRRDAILESLSLEDEGLQDIRHFKRVISKSMSSPKKGSEVSFKASTTARRRKDQEGVPSTFSVDPEAILKEAVKELEASKPKKGERKSKVLPPQKSLSQFEDIVSRLKILEEHLQVLEGFEKTEESDSQSNAALSPHDSSEVSESLSFEKKKGREEKAEGSSYQESSSASFLADEKEASSSYVLQLEEAVQTIKKRQEELDKGPEEKKSVVKKSSKSASPATPKNSRRLYRDQKDSEEGSPSVKTSKLKESSGGKEEKNALPELSLLKKEIAQLKNHLDRRQHERSFGSKNSSPGSFSDVQKEEANLQGFEARPLRAAPKSEESDIYESSFSSSKNGSSEIYAAVPRAQKGQEGTNLFLLQQEILHLSFLLHHGISEEKTELLTTALKDLTVRVAALHLKGVKNSRLRSLEDQFHLLRQSLDDLMHYSISPSFEKKIKKLVFSLQEKGIEGFNFEIFEDILEQIQKFKNLIMHVSERVEPFESFEKLIKQIQTQMALLYDFEWKRDEQILLHVLRDIRASIEDFTKTLLTRLTRWSHRLLIEVDEILSHSTSLQEREKGLGSWDITERNYENKTHLQEFPAAETKVLRNILSDIKDQLQSSSQESYKYQASLDKRLGKFEQEFETFLSVLPNKEEDLKDTLDKLTDRLDTHLRIPFKEMFSELTDRLEADSQNREMDVSLLEKKIRELTLYVKDLHERKTADPDHLEGLLETIREKVELLEARESRSAASEDSLVEILKEHIECLSEDRSQHEERLIEILEQSFDKISSHIYHVQKHDLDALKKEIQHSLHTLKKQEATAESLSSQSAFIEDISELRLAQEAADQRMHSTLTAVHQTLEKVFNRLSLLEEERRAQRLSSFEEDNSSHFSDPSHRTPRSSSFSKGERPSYGEDFEPDSSPYKDVLHTPYGTKRAFLDSSSRESELSPQARAGSYHEALQDSPPYKESRYETEEKEPVHHSSFIAAARRALSAHQKVLQSAHKKDTSTFLGHGDITPRREGSLRPTLNNKIREKLLQRLSKIIKRVVTTHKKPLIVGFIAVVLSFLSWQAMSVWREGRFLEENFVYESLSKKLLGRDITLPVQPSSLEKPAGGQKISNSPVAPVTPPGEAPHIEEGEKISSNLSNPSLTPYALSSNLEKSVLLSKAEPSKEGSLGEDKKVSGSADFMTKDFLFPGLSVRQSAEKGNILAQYELGQRLAEGRGESKSLSASVEWFEKAAQKNLIPAQYRMGLIYEKGLGVERNLTLARKWYESAAEGGNTRAMHNLGVLYAEGLNEGQPDYAQAARWFAQAASFGVRDSQYNLAILYARGLGVEKSLSQSYVWFSLAALQGDLDSGKKREEIGARLDSQQLNAAKLLIKAFKPKVEDQMANNVPSFQNQWEPSSLKSHLPQISRISTPSF